MGLLNLGTLVGTLEPFQIRILTVVVVGIIWAYLTYRACTYVIDKEQKREEYEKKHVHPFVEGTDSFLRTQNGKVRRKN
jgi:hypothetical protein